MDVRRVALVSALFALLAVIAVKLYPYYPSGRVGVVFYSCTKESQNREEFKATIEGVASLKIGPSTPVTVIVHGYTESSFRSWIIDLTNALLTIEPSSVVILVDYWDLTTLSRPYMAENVRLIANQTAALLDLLTQEKELRLSKVHLIGFSLGGRISGIIGDRVKAGKIGRITGLDASYPWAKSPSSAEFLDASDAELVVNMRTSPVGSQSPPGHIDFYGNDGLLQPGCDKWYFPNAIKNTCSHYRSVFMLIEAVQNAHKRLFPSCSCESWEKIQTKLCDCQVINHFGLYLDENTHGTFYCATNAESPYSRPLGV
ncbi:lipoprotein lipase-like [Penaeus japonicus]|uniref:lipoprotein lipase-like n=1 Tax=Penaeus japonicus TaxID=27405 RepID=UPI001C713254|nr:lipoprotein lipase-like [Penaeus japonicus]